MDTNKLIAERHTTHGDYTAQAMIYSKLCHAVSCPNIHSLGVTFPPAHESLSMILIKIARIAAGDPDFRDHWDDIAGYAKLAADRCSK